MQKCSKFIFKLYTPNCTEWYDACRTGLTEQSTAFHWGGCYLLPETNMPTYVDVGMIVSACQHANPCWCWYDHLSMPTCQHMLMLVWSSQHVNMPTYNMPTYVDVGLIVSGCQHMLMLHDRLSLLRTCQHMLMLVWSSQPTVYYNSWWFLRSVSVYFNLFTFILNHFVLGLSMSWHHQPWSSNWGFLVFCRPHTKSKQTKWVHDLCMSSGISHKFIFTHRPQYIPTWRILVILTAGKPEYPYLESYAGIKMAQVLGCPVLGSGLYLWF